MLNKIKNSTGGIFTYQGRREAEVDETSRGKIARPLATIEKRKIFTAESTLDSPLKCRQLRSKEKVN